MKLLYVFGIMSFSISMASCGSGGGGGGAASSSPGSSAPVCSRVSYSQQVIADSPVGYWRLDDTGTIAADLSGQGNSGTYVNGPTEGVTGVTTGDGDSAVTFNGTNQFVDIPPSTSLNNGNIKTVVTWFQTTSKFAVIFSVGDTVTDTYQVWVNSSGQASIWSNNAEIDGALVADGQWHMVAGVWDGTTGYVYVDGVLSNSGPLVIPGVSTLDGQIGSQCTGAGSTSCNSYVNGTIDEISVYNTALSASSIQALYNSPAVVPCN